MPRHFGSWILVVALAAACGGEEDPIASGGGQLLEGGNGGSAGDLGGAGGGGNLGGGGAIPDGPLEDFSIGPYPSALDMLDASIEAAFTAYDTSITYSHSAAQGYSLQAVGALLRVSASRVIPGGEARQVALVTAALDEVDELRAASGLVVSGGPAFGLEDAWDAFGDGSENPAFTAYTWQSGMVALGIAEVLRFASRHPALLSTEQARIDEAIVFLGQLIDYWTPFYTTVALGNETGGYFWYSDQSADAIAVHNTSALVAMASDIYGEIVGEDSYRDRAAACARLLLARTTITGSDGYSWNYADDGYPVASRRPEDVSHALVTTQFMRFATERGWWSSSDMDHVAKTFTRQMWAGHPARLNGRVDGTTGGDSEWTWTRAAVVGFATHGDAVGGDPALFDYARSILMSSYLTVFDRPLTGAVVGAPQLLTLGRLFEHRPTAFAPDSTMSVVAGPNDMEPGGVRFFTVDWDEPAEINVAGISVSARVAQTINSNVLVDLAEGDGRPVVVSITYSANANGEIGQWDGTNYLLLGAAPRTAAEDGTVRWMRTTVMLNSNRFDYQGGIEGTNLLLQFSNTPTIHRIEATPL